MLIGSAVHQHIGNVPQVGIRKDGVELTTAAAKVRITAVREGVIRVRVAPDGTLAKDSSWAVIETPEPPPIKVEDGKDELRMTAAGVVLLVNKAPLLIRFTDAGGNVLLEDEPSLPMAWSGKSVRAWNTMGVGLTGLSGRKHRTNSPMKSGLAPISLGYKQPKTHP